MENKKPDKTSKQPDKTSKQAQGMIDQIFRVNKEIEQRNTEAENISLIIKEWLNPRHIKRKTRYSKRQVRAVSILDSLAKTYKIKTLSRYLDTFRTTKLSEDGKSSAELEAILKSRMPEIEEGNLERLAKYLE